MQTDETNGRSPVSNERTGNLEATVPKIVDAIRQTEFGEVKVIIERGQVREIIRSEKIRI